MTRKMRTMDGSYVAAHTSYVFTDVAAIYPITPSSLTAEATDEWIVDRRTNIFGRGVQIIEVQSEAGAASAVYGSLATDTLVTTYTASQSLLLMIPNLYKITDEQLPGVFSVPVRALVGHALPISGDRSDIYAYRQTGCAMLCESGVQEVMDLTVAAHMVSIEDKVSFTNFFDDFRTSHGAQKIGTWDYEGLRKMVDMDIADVSHKYALSPDHPCQGGSAQSPDTFFQAKEVCNPYYDALPAIVQEYMDKINARIGTDYKLFSYYGAVDTEHIIISMGSVGDITEETIGYMMKQGQKVGAIKVRLYRPLRVQTLIDTVPDTVRVVSVLNRTKKPGTIDGPLYLDIVAALKENKSDQAKILTERCSLDSKDATSAQIVAVYGDTTESPFTVDIMDGVTNLSLEVGASLVTTPEGTTNCKFWGLGADGTVDADKNSIKIIGDNTNIYVQAYFDYNSKKPGGVTMPYLRFGHSPIKSTYSIRTANLVAYHNPAYVRRYSIAQELVDDGTSLLNHPWDMEGLEKHFPGQVKEFIADHNINLYTVDDVKIGIGTGMGSICINTILQSTLFELTGVIPAEKANELMKAAVKATCGRKGEDVVQRNWTVVDTGAKGIHKVEVPESWKNCEDEGFDHAAIIQGRKNVADFVNNIQTEVNTQEGNSLSVSAFTEYADGSIPSGTSAYEKRSIAVKVPVWNPDSYIQCSFCAYVCLHAVVRPVAMAANEAAKAPAGMKMKGMTGMTGYKFAIIISVLDCMGYDSCTNVCSGTKGNKALAMESLEASLGQQVIFGFGQSPPIKEEVLARFKENTVKGSQFRQPLLEFSGACAGCGETPYAKLITQLPGDRMYIANATGCPSIRGNSLPSTPYIVNAKGQGPAWDNSLFEDNAGFGYGMLLAQNAIRSGLKAKAESVMADEKAIDEMRVTCKERLDMLGIGALSGTAADKLVAALGGVNCDVYRDIAKNKGFLAKKSQWIFGGGGWVCDIGFNGVDHVLASGKDINIMIYDTEVYFNTGGQSSKATKTGTAAQLAVGGKDVRRKDLASTAMGYDYVHVAQIYMGADMAQTAKTTAEAKAYPGPPLTIAYAPRINHGIKKGMDKVQIEGRLAVECGYWNNFRYNLVAEKKFTLGSKAPKFETYQDFLKGEARYMSLAMKNPERATELLTRSEAEARKCYAYLEKLVMLYDND